MNAKNYVIECRGCGERTKALRPNDKYCSSKCRDKLRAKTTKRKDWKKKWLTPDKQKKYNKTFRERILKSDPDYDKKHYQRYKETIRAGARKQSLKKYGLTVDDFIKILDDQGGRCFICRRTPIEVYKSKSRHLCVDHDHTTGRIRGVLCRFCNGTLTGFTKEDPELVMRIHDYLTRETNYGHAPG